MPILRKERDIYPDDLLRGDSQFDDLGKQWWCLYTMSRREKQLMRLLVEHQIWFYGPTIGKRSRSPSGRMRTSYVPLFPNYVFIYGGEDDRLKAVKTNCVSKCMEILDPAALVTDLRQVFHVIEAGIPVTPEAKLQPGHTVRVRGGIFAGFEGVVLRREGKTRLLLSVRFLESGVSMEIDEGLLDPL